MREEFKKTPETEIEEKNKVINLFDEMGGKLEEIIKEAEEEKGPEGEMGQVSQDNIDGLLGGYFHELEGLVSPIELATGDKFSRNKIIISPDNRGLLEKRVTRYAEGATTTYNLLNPKRTEQLLKESVDKFSQEVEKIEEKKRKCEAVLKKFGRS